MGVGIPGTEGMHAVNSADFSISKFSYLRKLLLVHGRWGYRRVAMFINYYFYKNITLVFAEIGFSFISGFGG